MADNVCKTYIPAYDQCPRAIYSNIFAGTKQSQGKSAQQLNAISRKTIEVFLAIELQNYSPVVPAVSFTPRKYVSFQ